VTDPTQNADPIVVSVDAAAAMLGVSRNFAYALVNSGALPAVRLGRRWLIPKSALERMLADAVDAARPQPKAQ
jgi:excisionase family DNA binding protein